MAVEFVPYDNVCKACEVPFQSFEYRDVLPEPMKWNMSEKICVSLCILCLSTTTTRVIDVSQELKKCTEEMLGQPLFQDLEE